MISSENSAAVPPAGIIDNRNKKENNKNITLYNIVRIIDGPTFNPPLSWRRVAAIVPLTSFTDMTWCLTPSPGTYTRAMSGYSFRVFWVCRQHLRRHRALAFSHFLFRQKQKHH
eukprot:GHVU01234872.1.p2 GENE.GHVU01234872.1~~GHVU01234872.1.p2  ORF type:complete len:114 (+),score=4.12 GHVU01234872.1:674-1015(+)